MKLERSILEVQSEIETALRYVRERESQLPDALKPLARLAPPIGGRAQVSLRHSKTARQVKRNASADSWSPESGIVSISYALSAAGFADRAGIQVAEAAQPAAPSKSVAPEDSARDLLLALAKAEQDPQLDFVSLKWFRDNYLPQQGYAWTTTPQNRQRILVEALDRKWILTSKVPNPKNPQYPVTAIKVNRPLADVRRILDQEAGSGSAFAPIVMQGERLSETVLRQRR